MSFGPTYNEIYTFLRYTILKTNKIHLRTYSNTPNFYTLDPRVIISNVINLFNLLRGLGGHWNQHNNQPGQTASIPAIFISTWGHICLEKQRVYYLGPCKSYSNWDSHLN